MWKQDLATLKRQLGEAPLPAKAAPAPKPAPTHLPPQSMAEEDALFLRSMGQSGAPPADAEEAPPLAVAPPPQLQPAPQEDPESFTRAMSGLKGLKPLDTAPVAVPAPAPAKAKESPAALSPPLLSHLLAASEETRPLDHLPPPAPEALKPKGPVLIQLAAGMAIEVDGILDLRNHTLSDARERLKERVEDAGHLGWRSLHVILGPSEALKQGFLAFLTTPAAKPVGRYAQAPIPMGGIQAWIVYLSGTTA